MSNRLLAGRYELIEKIGEGGMAVVYKARCRLLNRYVAIKILRPEFTQDESFIENFRKESQAAAGMTHPNIVSVFDVGREGKLHFIVMELVEGKTLSQLIAEKGRLDYKEAIEITRQVASALSLAHKNQIIHRDVKPHNILITSSGVAKLADFGIARAVNNSNVVGEGNNNKVMGSVHYLSPEQARGSYVDERSDIYSLGIVLYEMLTGKVPFDGDNAISIALMHINNQMTPPSQVVTGIPPQLEKMILKATDKYQNNRYSTADQLIEELDNIDFITKVMGKKAFGVDGGQSVSVRDPLYDDGYFAETPDYPAERDRYNRGNRERERSYEEDLTTKKIGKESGKSNKNGKNKNSGNKIFVVILVAALILCAAGIVGLGSMLGWFGGSDDITIPQLSGKTFEQASAELEALGLLIEEGQHVYSPDYEVGQITSQTPSAGTLVKEGYAVTVNISKGKKDGVVPTITNMDYKEAERYLEQFGFKLGEITVVESHLPKDVVISQKPEAGGTAASGASINIEISDGKGKEMTKVPNLIGMTKEQADAALAAEGLTVDVDNILYEENEFAPPNTVIYQDPMGDDEVEVGSMVAYTLTKAPETIPPIDGEGDGDREEDVDSDEFGGYYGE